MCGIVGIIDLSSREVVDSERVKKMCRVIRHRGPDDEGIHVEPSAGLGHRRLSIIDLEGGHQPMSNEDGSVWIVFNGEIYNYAALKSSLEAKGHVFRTKSDTEVIIHLYEDQGEGCVAMLEGMFSFALWDRSKRELLAARDRMGKKPFHYCLSGKSIIFSSEIKGILQDPHVPSSVDTEALHDYLTLMYVPSPRTMFKAVKKLPAGHYMVFGSGGFAVRKYWDVDFSSPVISDEDEIKSELFRILGASVKSRLMSDVPLGAFLSGGVDSSSVVYFMNACGVKPLITNSIGFEEGAFDELHYSREVAERYAAEHHEYVVGPQAADTLNTLVGFYDEPIGDSSAIPSYHVSRMTRKNVKVALSGDGGDEVFAGYPRYAYCRMAFALRNALPPAMRLLAERAGDSLGKRKGGVLSGKLERKLRELHYPLFDTYLKVVSIFSEEEKKGRLYSSRMLKKIGAYDTREALRSIYDSCASDDPIARMQYLDMKTYLTDDILVKVDIASMANSLEVRSPLLDRELVEFAATIPSRYKVKNMCGKYVFKSLMNEYLPRGIAFRRKQGFSVPLEAWLRTEFREMVEKELFSGKSCAEEYFDMNYVKTLWGQTLSGGAQFFDRTDVATRIWLIFMFCKWHGRFFSGE
jgi:asparagine synthase (glutamine-hydrolysing)